MIFWNLISIHSFWFQVIVNDIESYDACSCLTESGKTLWDLNPNKLETVIPKKPMSIIMILKGKYKGQVSSEE